MGLVYIMSHIKFWGGGIPLQNRIVSFAMYRVAGNLNTSCLPDAARFSERMVSFKLIVSSKIGSQSVILDRQIGRFFCF